MARVHVYDEAGRLVGPVESPNIVLDDAEWRRRLTPEQYRVLRNQGTERAFCGNLLDNKREGVYTCAGCGLPLFSSEAKFNSGTGWPSFFQPVAASNVVENRDVAHGMVRTEIVCARCAGHLGHVFDDGPRPTGLRFCLNSESLNFTPSSELATLADPGPAGAASPVPAKPHAEGSAPSPTSATAVLAGGCFWCTEAAFEQLAGVSDVESGYIGGARQAANYRRVCEGDTGHAEAIRITYDPARINFERLLDVFFDAHDPTQLNRQGADVGSQYRSAIFFANEAERTAAQAKIDELTRSKNFPSRIVTTLEPLAEFYPAEDYHQDYARQNPDQPYIQALAIPKACKIRHKYADLVEPVS